ncbi:uncharacterized protein [Amphiura filiformis]|uniref:uncharacterized protein n=1 Tax=Amphiura filiformis TaxID=82378 RepID=UPI003B216986
MNMAEDLLQLLECHICSEVFDDSDRKPKVLPCQHTFCLACLRKMAKTKFNPDSNGFFRLTLITIKCPECSQEFNAPDGGVANFINNLTMMELLRVIPQTTGESSSSADLKRCLSGRLQRLQTKLSQVAEVRAKQVSSWEKEVSDSRATIQAMFAEFHRALHDRENSFLNQLDEFNQTRDSLVHKTMTRAYEVQMQEIVEFCSRTEEMINEKSFKISERMISENLNKCLEIMEQLEGAGTDETNGKKWKVQFHPCARDTLQAAIDMFGRLVLDSPQASSQQVKQQETSRPRRVYTRGYLLAFQTKCLNRPDNLPYIQGVTLNQPEIQQITESPSSCMHRPLVACPATRDASKRHKAPCHPPWLAVAAPRRNGNIADSDGSRMQEINWLTFLQKEISQLLTVEPDNVDVCHLIERHTNTEQRESKEFMRMLATEFLENPGGPTAMQATLLGMSYTIPGYQVILRDRVAVLRKYIEASADSDLELEILYAAQAFNFQVGNPPGLLKKIFDALSDEDVVEEETFFDWLNCSDPAEHTGKAIAVKATQSFFTHLMDDNIDTDQESPPPSTNRMNQSSAFTLFRPVTTSPPLSPPSTQDD